MPSTALRWLVTGTLYAALILLLTPAPAGRQLPRTSYSRPVLQDADGRLQVGCGFDGALSAPEVCKRGAVLGVYIDDTTPNLAYWVRLAAKHWPLVIVARAPGQRGCPYSPQPPVLCAQEWYPYNSGYPPQAWGAMPRAKAYILQWRFSFLGPPPTRRERARLLRQARARHPRLILLY